MPCEMPLHPVLPFPRKAYRLFHPLLAPILLPSRRLLHVHSLDPALQRIEKQYVENGHGASAWTRADLKKEKNDRKSLLGGGRTTSGQWKWDKRLDESKIGRRRGRNGRKSLSKNGRTRCRGIFRGIYASPKLTAG